MMGLSMMLKSPLNFDERIVEAFVFNFIKLLFIRSIFKKPQSETKGS
jgi:hypothetical protein